MEQQRLNYFVAKKLDESVTFLTGSCGIHLDDSHQISDKQLFKLTSNVQPSENRLIDDVIDHVSQQSSVEVKNIKFFLWFCRKYVEQFIARQSKYGYKLYDMLVEQLGGGQIISLSTIS